MSSHSGSRRLGKVTVTVRNGSSVPFSPALQATLTAAKGLLGGSTRHFEASSCTVTVTIGDRKSWEGDASSLTVGTAAALKVTVTVRLQLLRLRAGRSGPSWLCQHLLSRLGCPLGVIVHLLTQAHHAPCGVRPGPARAGSPPGRACRSATDAQRHELLIAESSSAADCLPFAHLWHPAVAPRGRAPCKRLNNIPVSA
jgi:hypothetical protein